MRRPTSDRQTDALSPHADQRGRRRRARSTYLAVLVLQLNPRMPLLSATALGWIGAVLVFYAPYLSVGALLAARRPRDRGAARPFAGLGQRPRAGLVGAVRRAARRRDHVGEPAAPFASVLTMPATRDARWRPGGDRPACAACCSWSSRCFGTRSAARGARPRPRLVAAGRCASSVAVPLWLRGPRRDAGAPARGRWTAAGRSPSGAPAREGDARSTARSLGFIRSASRPGQLPNFGRMLDRGAVDRPGHAPADPGGAGLGGRGHGQAAAEERRALERRSIGSATPTTTSVRRAAGLLFRARRSSIRDPPRGSD